MEPPTEMHSRPESLEEFVSRSSVPPSLWAAVREMAVATHAMLGEERTWWRPTERSAGQSSFMGIFIVRPYFDWVAKVLRSGSPQLP